MHSVNSGGFVPLGSTPEINIGTTLRKERAGAVTASARCLLQVCRSDCRLYSLMLVGVDVVDELELRQSLVRLASHGGCQRDSRNQRSVRRRHQRRTVAEQRDQPQRAGRCQARQRVARGCYGAHPLLAVPTVHCVLAMAVEHLLACVHGSGESSGARAVQGDARHSTQGLEMVGTPRKTQTHTLTTTSSHNQPHPATTSGNKGV